MGQSRIKQTVQLELGKVCQLRIAPNSIVHFMPMPRSWEPASLQNAARPDQWTKSGLSTCRRCPKGTGNRDAQNRSMRNSGIATCRSVLPICSRKRSGSLFQSSKSTRSLPMKSLSCRGQRRKALIFSSTTSLKPNSPASASKRNCGPEQKPRSPAASKNAESRFRWRRSQKGNQR